jgi:hypothetical protein
MAILKSQVQEKRWRNLSIGPQEAVLSDKRRSTPRKHFRRVVPNRIIDIRITNTGSASAIFMQIKPIARSPIAPVIIMAPIIHHAYEILVIKGMWQKAKGEQQRENTLKSKINCKQVGTFCFLKQYFQTP